MRISGKFLVTAFLISFSGAVCTGEQRAALSPDGSILASMQADCTVVLQDVRSGQKIATLYQPSRICTGVSDNGALAQHAPTHWVSFSPDGRLLATAPGGYGMLDVWRVGDHRRVASFDRVEHISSLEFLPDSKLILTVGSQGKSGRGNSIAVLKVATGKKLLHVSESGDKSFTKVALSPDGRTVMALVGPRGGRPNAVRLWDIERPEEPVTLKGQSAWFLPGDNLLLITDSGRPVVWDVKAGKAIRSVQAVEHPEPARDFTADNVAQSIGDNKWSWTVFLRGDRQRIDDIKCVEYKLHPTFPHPIRRICEKRYSNRPFGLSATGWGTFTIPIRVFMKDGTILHMKHQLKF